MLFRFLSLFCFNDTATTEIYTLSLHDALPISNTFPFAGNGSSVLTCTVNFTAAVAAGGNTSFNLPAVPTAVGSSRSEEHTSELQSPDPLVSRLLLAKKKLSNAPTRLAVSRTLF